MFASHTMKEILFLFYGASGSFWYDPRSLAKFSAAGLYDSLGDLTPNDLGSDPYTVAP